MLLASVVVVVVVGISNNSWARAAIGQLPAPQNSITRSGALLALAEPVVDVSKVSSPTPSPTPTSLTARVAGMAEKATLQLLGPLQDARGKTGSAGQVLTSQGKDNPPQWEAVSVPAGVIQFYAGAEAPAGWMECDGRELSRSQYTTLFAALGTTWGVGNDSTTFNIPDLRGRVPVAAGDPDGEGDDTITGRLLGQKGGAEKHKLANADLPANDYLSGGGIRTDNIRHDADSARTFYGDTGTSTTIVQGGNQPFSLLPPFAVVKCIIKL